MTDNTSFHFDGTTVYGSLESEARRDVLDVLEPLLDEAGIDPEAVALRKLEITEHGSTVLELHQPLKSSTNE